MRCYIKWLFNLVKKNRTAPTFKSEIFSVQLQFFFLVFFLWNFPLLCSNRTVSVLKSVVIGKSDRFNFKFRYCAKNRTDSILNPIEQESNLKLVCFVNFFRFNENRTTEYSDKFLRHFKTQIVDFRRKSAILYNGFLIEQAKGISP